jgi:tetratricopeptide (TPR) repeat protein
MRLWVGTSSESPTVTESLRDFLDGILQNTRKPFNPTASVGAQTLLWKQIELAFEKKQYERCEGWCRLSLHPIFGRSGEFNRAKIARKFILCALARQDFVSAREAYFQMPESGRAAAQTQFLMYRVALRSGDVDLAAESLDAVCRHSSKDATLLYACALEAQQIGDKVQAIAALQKVLEKYDYNAPKGVHLPALLRYAVATRTQESRN